MKENKRNIVKKECKHYLDDTEGIVERRAAEKENFKKNEARMSGLRTRLMAVGRRHAIKNAKAMSDSRRLVQIKVRNAAIKIIKKHIPDLKVKIGTCKHCGEKFRYIQNWSCSSYKMNAGLKEELEDLASKHGVGIQKISDVYCSYVCKNREAQDIKKKKARKAKRTGSIDTRGYVLTTYMKTNDHGNRILLRKFVKNLTVGFNGLKYDEAENFRYDYVTKNFEARVINDNYNPIQDE